VDDVLDALVAAITARRMPDGTLTVPDAPPTDAPADTEQTRLSTLGESTE
jgi:predicted RNase H-like nuclease